MQASQARAWLVRTPWAALAVLLSAGVLCGTAVRNAIALVQVEVLQAVDAGRATELDNALAHFTPAGLTLRAAQATQVISRKLHIIALNVQETAPNVTPLVACQEGAETNPRFICGHHQALSRHGPLLD